MAAKAETIQDTSTGGHQARLVLRGLVRDDGTTDAIAVDADTLNNDELLAVITKLLKVEAIDPVELNQVDEERRTKEQERIRMTVDTMKSVAIGDLPWVRDFVEAMRFGNLACGGVSVEAARFDDMFWVVEFVEAAIRGDLKHVERIWFSEKIKHIDARDKDKWTALEGAITKSRRAVVLFLLSKGASVDCRMSNGTTALQIAAHYQDLTIVKILVDANADLEAKSEKYELTALHFAAEVDSEDIAAFLIRKGASINTKIADGSTPLHTAASHGSDDVALLLTKVGATVDSKDTDGSSPLLVAARCGFLKIVNRLLQAGAQPSVKDRWGQSPLMMACAEGHLGIVKRLLEDNNLDLDIRDEDERTPLMWAADKGHLEIVKYLIEKRAEVNAEDINMNTPLALATYSRHVEVFKYLISSGASLECKTSEGLTLFDIAVEQNCLEIAEYLVDVAHVDPDKPFANGATPLEYAVNKGYHKMIAFLRQRCGLHQKLWYAAYTGDVKEVKSLIRDGVDILKRHFLGWSVLYTACSLGHVDAAYEIVKTLKDLGKKDLVQQLLELPDLYGSTPLFVAVFSGKLDLVKLLVSEGASVNAENNAGDMALTVAIHHNEYEIVDYLIKNGADIRRNPKTLLGAAIEGHDRIVRLLLQAGAETESTVASKRSPLMVACKNGHLQVVKSLIKRGVNLEAQDNNGFTALMYAAQQGHFGVVRLLVENRVNVNAKNHLGQTPLHLAVENKFLDVSLLLIACEASIKCVTYDGYTPLHSFAARGQIEMVKLAVKLEADVNAAGIDEFSSSYAAASNGKFEVVDYLADHGARQEFSSQRVWTLQSLRETYGCADFNPKPDSKWYIDPSKVDCPHLDEADFEGVLEGKWLESAVTIVKPCVTEKSHVRQFVASLETWNPLNHPHVLKLLGACHQNQHFFVAEQAKNGNLRSYLKTHPKEIWKILHEAALALQYMHERRIVHGGVQGSTILIGNDGSAKLIALGPLEKSLIPSESLPWQAPEAVLECRVSMESDVYSLGMCIIEAITGDDPYTYEVNRQNKDLRQLKKDKTLPRKPTRLSDAGWELVFCMTREQPAARLKMADVVRELEMFRKSKRGAETTDAGSVCEFSGDADGNIAESMRKAQSLCTMTAHSSLEGKLITRWEALWNHLTEELVNTTQDQRDSYPTNLYGIANLPSLYPVIYATCVPQQLLLLKLRDLVNRLIRYLEVQKPITHRLALGRQREEVMYSLHSATDWLVKLAQPHSSPSEARGEWKYQWRVERTKRQQALSGELKQLQSLDGIDSSDQIEYMTYLMFELTAHPDSYTLIDQRIVRDALQETRAYSLVQVQRWFIPYYDIEPEKMNDENKVHSGRIESVLRVKWMGTTVVVQTLFDKSVQNAAAFKDNVSIWFGLYHPHVIKLFGACNVGEKKVFVCEYTTGGELRKYLKQHRDELWQKLYEAALGLHYLHENGIMHGDLKGDNILVGSDGNAKIANFGLSSGTVIPGNDDVRDGIIILGAPRWRAPEALRGDEVTLKADVYAFAMCIVEIYTGEPPWMEENPDEDQYYQTAMIEERMRPHKIPQKEWNVIKGMCRLSPAERPDMRQVVKMLGTLSGKCEIEPLEEPSSTLSVSEELNIQSSNQNTIDVVVERSLALCAEMLETEPLCRHVASRFLTLVNRSLATLSGVETSVDVLVRRLETLMIKRVDQVTAFRLVSARAFAEAIEYIHIQLDRFESRNEGSQTWREQWTQDVNYMKKTLFASVDVNAGMSRIINDLSDEDKQTEAMALFIHKIKYNSEHYDSHELALLRKLLNQVVSFSNLRVPELEEWFIPRHEVEFDKEIFARGGFGEVYRGRWCKTDVVIKTIKIGKKEAFLQEVKVWRQARHQNVVQFFGAYHLDSPFFIVCEYAPGGTLMNYLYKHRGRATSCVWRKLVEVANALFCLHGKGIVHGDLKCDNILIGSDGRAMLTDFGMSFFEGSENRADAKNLGAFRWRAPEVVERGIAGATFASDVFSLGMCVVEAVTGEVPWGPLIPDAGVKHHLRLKQMLKQPSRMKESEWEVVECMSRYESGERMPLEDVVKKFEDFANYEIDLEIEVFKKKKEESRRQEDRARGLKKTT